VKNGASYSTWRSSLVLESLSNPEDERDDEETTNFQVSALASVWDLME